MKIALDWIAEYLDAPVAPAAAEGALIAAGLPLESNEAVGKTHVLDVEVTSNRSDCLCHVGLARELGALLGRTFRMPEPKLVEAGPEAGTLTAVAVEDLKGCPYYSARVIQGVKVGPSPAWLVERLEAIGLRSVNNVVDVTNYVMMELGQPLHAFDFDTLEGRRIMVRRARAGEKITSIDGKSNTLEPSMLVIADARNPVAVAGVMGGKDTEVTEGTTNVLLEAARFDPVTIRAQARGLALMSDSSYRFERGIDPTAAERASRRAAELILQVAGGTLAKGVVAAGSAAATPVRVELRLGRIRQILGYEVPAERAVAILAALGFAPQREGERVRCTVPSHRLDIEREIDLVEEVARVYGYDKIPLLDRVVHSVQPEPVEEKAGRAIRDELAGAGFNEAITVTFIHGTDAAAFLPSSMGEAIPLAHQGWKGEVLRCSLFPSLLQVRRVNQNAGIPDARLFEQGEVFWQAGDAKVNPPSQARVLAVLGNSVAEVRGALELIVARLNPRARLIVRPGARAWYAAGVGATVAIELGGREHVLGCLGQFSAEIQGRYDLRHEVSGAEVFWEPLLEVFEPVRRAHPLPRFPGIRRDLSVVVDEAMRWAEVEAAVRGARLPFLAAVDFVTTFRSKQIGAGKKSLTLALEFRDPNATLRSEQVDTQMKSAMDVLAGQFGAALRA